MNKTFFPADVQNDINNWLETESVWDRIDNDASMTLNSLAGEISSRFKLQGFNAGHAGKHVKAIRKVWAERKAVKPDSPPPGEDEPTGRGAEALLLMFGDMTRANNVVWSDATKAAISALRAEVGGDFELKG